MNCPSCGKPIQPEYSFCPYCGRELVERPVSIASQIGIYALAVFLPPLGLWPGISYLKRRDPKAKQVGIIAIVLTVVASIATFWYTMHFLNVYLDTLNQTLNGLQ